MDALNGGRGAGGVTLTPSPMIDYESSNFLFEIFLGAFTASSVDEVFPWSRRSPPRIWWLTLSIIQNIRSEKMFSIRFFSNFLSRIFFHSQSFWRQFFESTTWSLSFEAINFGWINPFSFRISKRCRGLRGRSDDGIGSEFASNWFNSLSNFGAIFRAIEFFRNQLLDEILRIFKFLIDILSIYFGVKSGKYALSVFFNGVCILRTNFQGFNFFRSQIFGTKSYGSWSILFRYATSSKATVSLFRYCTNG